MDGPGHWWLNKPLRAKRPPTRASTTFVKLFSNYFITFLIPTHSGVCKSSDGAYGPIRRVCVQVQVVPMAPPRTVCVQVQMVPLAPLQYVCVIFYKNLQSHNNHNYLKYSELGVPVKNKIK